MAGQYLAVVGADSPDGAVAANRVRALCNRRADLHIVVDQPDLLLIATNDLPTLPVGRDEGAVLGQLYSRSTGALVKSLDGGWKHAIPVSNGSTLTQEFWGSYVAFVRGARSRQWSVVRAPFGALSCLMTRLGTALLVASDLGLLAEAGWTPQGVAWDQVASHLAMRDLRRAATCLIGVEELLGGDRMTLADGKVAIHRIWTPWKQAERCGSVASRALAVEAVRQAVLNAVRSTVSRATRPLLLLSGGLDSSIVAASLSALERPFSCLNLASAGAIGDERDYARLVADALGVELFVAQWDVRDVDVTRSAAADMPNPSARSFMQASDHLTNAAAARAGADLVVDGGGGDNVFCALQSVAPVADAMLHGEPFRRTLAVAGTMAGLAQASVSNVLLRAVRRAYLRSAAYRWSPELRFLSRAAQFGGSVAVAHPWLEPPRGSTPGTAAHIAMVVAAQSWAEVGEPRALASASPLVAQPVVEACLRVPSWWWFAEGRNRAIAREAFEGMLPDETLKRSSKGSPDSFVAELFELNRPMLRAMLLDGRLRAEGILDAQAVEQVLADPRPAVGADYRRIMRLADVEAWAANWTAPIA